MINRKVFDIYKTDGKIRCDDCPLRQRDSGKVSIPCGAKFQSHLQSKKISDGSYRPDFWYSDDCTMLSVTLTMKRKLDEEKK